MKRSMFVTLLVTFFILVISHSSSAVTTTDGIVYSNGKDAIFKSFQDGTETNLTSHISGIQVGKVFAVNEDCTVLFWYQDSKLWRLALSFGKPCSLKYNQQTRENANGVVTATQKVAIAVPRDINKLVVSPDGLYLSYEHEVQGVGHKQVPPGKVLQQLDAEWLTSADRANAAMYKMRAPFRKHPMFIEEPQSFNAVTLMSCSLATGFDDIWEKHHFLGNSAFAIPVAPYRIPRNTADFSMGERDYRLGEWGDENGFRWPAIVVGTGMYTGWLYGPIPDINGTKYHIIHPTFEDGIKRYSKIRSACYPCFAKEQSWNSGKRMSGVIYGTPAENGYRNAANNTETWGPIEIRDPETNDQAKKWTDHKPGVYEFPVQLTNCTGLAWKPDGSLTYLVNGKVFLIPGSEIRKTIENSGLRKDSSTANANFAARSEHNKLAGLSGMKVPKENPATVPVGNIITATPVVVAEDINGDRLHWVSNEVLRFRGTDGCIYEYSQGKAEKISGPAPSIFSYSRAPKEIKPQIASSSRPEGQTQPFAQGTSRAFEAIQGQFSNHGSGVVYFHVGDIENGIETHWVSFSSKSVLIYLEKGKQFKEKPLLYAVPKEDDLDQISDPQKYDYTTKIHEIVEINKIIILKSGDKYAAIKPRNLTYKYPLGKDRPDWLKSWKKWEEKNGEPAPLFETMTYDWKYWAPGLTTKASGSSFQSTADSTTVVIGGIPKIEPPKPKIPKVTFSHKKATLGQVFQLAEMKLKWQAGQSDSASGITLDVRYRSDGLSGFLLKEGNLSEIDDPSQFTFKNVQSNGKAHIELKDIMIFKFENKYFALQPEAIEGDQVSYGMKYWPYGTVPSGEIAATP